MWKDETNKCYRLAGEIKQALGDAGLVRSQGILNREIVLAPGQSHVSVIALLLQDITGGFSVSHGSTLPVSVSWWGAQSVEEHLHFVGIVKRTLEDLGFDLVTRSPSDNPLGGQYLDVYGRGTVQLALAELVGNQP